jgi:hypothetical protein
MGTCCGRDDARQKRRLQQLVDIVSEMAMGSERRVQDRMEAVVNLERLRTVEESKRNPYRCGETC